MTCARDRWSVLSFFLIEPIGTEPYANRIRVSCRQSPWPSAALAAHVGYGLVFRIAAGGMFGAEQRVSLRLLEHPEQMRRLQATAMELTDCAFPLLHSFAITDDPLEAFAGGRLDRAAGRQPARRAPAFADRHAQGQRRESTSSTAGRSIKASPAARILVVAAPCNANCMIAMSQGPGRAPSSIGLRLTGWIACGPRP